MIQNYQAAYRQTSVNTATPGKLLIMLFDGLTRFIASATRAIEVNDYESSHKSLIRAQEIILELKTTLNHTVAPQLCQTLESLYDYFNDQLIKANTEKSHVPLEGIVENIHELRNAFAAAEEQVLQARSEENAAND